VYTGTLIALEIFRLNYFRSLTTISGMQPGEEDKLSGIINPDLTELRQQLAIHDKEIAELRGNMQQINKLVSSVHRQSTLQIAAIVISLCLTIAGGLYFQTNAIDRRIEQLEKRLDGRIAELDIRMDGLDRRLEGVEKRMDRIERNLDDLNKEMHAQRQGK
jgi:prefoldin subunit 5